MPVCLASVLNHQSGEMAASLGGNHLYEAGEYECSSFSIVLVIDVLPLVFKVSKLRGQHLLRLFAPKVQCYYFMFTLTFILGWVKLATLFTRIPFLSDQMKIHTKSQVDLRLLY